MNGVYIHIPFCKTKCFYCDFYSITDNTGQENYIATLLSELTMRKDYLSDKQVDTVYLGGGTPSLLTVRQLNEILRQVHETFEVTSNAEITIEANPDDLHPKLLNTYLNLGFNRISIGIQSFVDEHLKWMNRRHNAEQAATAVDQAAAAGFRAISLDLIYGIPGMTRQQWKQNLDTATALPANHLSAYHLTWEPNTPFGKLQQKGELSEISEDQSIEQYQMLLETMAAHGFQQYEISNFARNQQYSRHNTKYWTGEPYIGLGPSAHSFNGNQRNWNPANLILYTQQVENGIYPEGEYIDQQMKQNEYILTRLRTHAGIKISEYIGLFGKSAFDDLLKQAHPYIQNGSLIWETNRIRFTPMAWFRSDGIMADLFTVQ